MYLRGIIYRNIYWYRFCMLVLYRRARFERYSVIRDQIVNLKKDSRVLELCFGDTYIANLCHDNDIQWTGIDINQSFVDRARRRSYRSFCMDLHMGAKLEESDLVIMVGSFYHFHDHIQDLLTTIFQSSKYFLLVEPVRNLSGKNGIVTKLLAIAADPGTGNIAFRYEALDLIEELNGLSPLIGFDVEQLECFPRDKAFLLQSTK